MFQILAVVLIATAAIFLWQSDTDTAFVTAVLGMCALLLSVRFHLKERIVERTEAEAAETANDSENEPGNEQVSP